MQIQGDNPKSIVYALDVLVAARVIQPSEVGAFAVAMTFGPGYNRGVRDNIARAVWAVEQHGELTTGEHWVEMAKRCLR